VPHHLIDVVPPDERFSVASYIALAERAIAETWARGKLPLVVGGTGFYIRALTQGLPTAPEVDPRCKAIVEAL
jgi:tRNA dimethylallyltransferase